MKTVQKVCLMVAQILLVGHRIYIFLALSLILKGASNDLNAAL
jgi:hypothetical protein